MFLRSLRTFLLAGSALLLLAAETSRAATWLPYGPDGGDARSLAVDPTNHAHLYLGTANGWIYETLNSGGEWKRLARVGKRDDLVLDTILVDPANPKHVTVGAWVLDHADGGVYQTTNGGANWTAAPDMQGQSIRSLAGAPSDPSILIAGTLKGIFRTSDSGGHWQRISPADSTEIHEVQSLAIDPLDPLTIYAGTWHLPWKTTDGGVTWAPIKQGVIDDSDVFSIIVDPKDPRIVFASACSGIYKSEDKGEKFRKVQGIPLSARRTLVLMQDPQHQNVVFAGTTEGLWKTEDAGANWVRTTGPELIVNDVFIDPTDTQKMLLATDRGGVLTSEDGGTTFVPANRGFSARQITAFVEDAQRPGTVYAGVVNDKEWGGVFVSSDGGLSWTQRSEGLGGRDVFSLGQAADGTVLAGTAHGIFRLIDQSWIRTNDGDAPVIATPRAVNHPAEVPVRPLAAGARPSSRKTASKTASKAGTRAATQTPRTRRVIVNGKSRTVAAADPTTRRSAPRSTVHRPAGRTKSASRAIPRAAIARAAVPPDKATKLPDAGPSAFDGAVHAIVRVGSAMFAGTSRGMLSSDDAGAVWHTVTSFGDEEWRFLAANGRNVLAASIGVMKLSTDEGTTWAEVAMPAKVTQISAVAVDGRGELWVGSREGVYLSSDKGMSWQTLKNLYVRDVDGLYFDARTDQLMVTSNGAATIVFAVEVPTRKVTFWDTGWTLRFVRPVGDHLVGATLFDGFVVQPRMVEAKGSGGA